MKTSRGKPITLGSRVSLKRVLFGDLETILISFVRLLNPLALAFTKYFPETISTYNSNLI